MIEFPDFSYPSKNEAYMSQYHLLMTCVPGPRNECACRMWTKDCSSDLFLMKPLLVLDFIGYEKTFHICRNHMTSLITSQRGDEIEIVTPDQYVSEWVLGQ